MQQNQRSMIHWWQFHSLYTSKYNIITRPVFVCTSNTMSCDGYWTTSVTPANDRNPVHSAESVTSTCSESDNFICVARPCSIHLRTRSSTRSVVSIDVLWVKSRDTCKHVWFQFPEVNTSNYISRTFAALLIICSRRKNNIKTGI